MYKNIFYIMFFSFWCWACSSAYTENRISEYYSADYGTALILVGHKGYLGQNPAAPEPLSNSKRLMEILTPLKILPITGGSCFAYEHFTFAIKTRTKAGDTYQCNGVGFRVLNCGTSNSTCHDFVVEARCFNFSNAKCNPGGKEADLTLIYQYRYNVDVGILSVDFAPGDSRSEVLRLAGNAGFQV